MISSLMNSIIVAMPICIIVFVINIIFSKKLHVTWRDNILRCVLTGYICVLLIQTLLDRPHLGEYKIAYPFQSLINAFKDGTIYTWQYFFINIAIFIPYGILVPLVFSGVKPFKTVLISALLASLSIELLQLVTQMGIFEIDDIITNTIGAVLGSITYIGIKKVQNICNKNKNTMPHNTNRN